MRRVDALFNHYASYHRSRANKAIHWICVPLIVWSVLGLLWAASPISACVAIAASVVFYVTLSLRIAVAMLLIIGLMLAGVAALGAYTLPVSVFVFVAAWAGQFIGHRIEGRKPAFLEDVRSFLVAPAWLLGDLLQRVGIGY